MSDVINLEMLEELKEIMEEEFPSLLETFVVEAARQYEEAKSAWDAQDMEVLRRAAHSLKGSSGNVGAEDLQAICADLEHSARDEQADVIPELLANTGEKLDAVTSAVQSLLH